MPRAIPRCLPQAPFTCGETANGPRRISTLAVAATTQSPLPTSVTHPAPPRRLSSALSFALEKVAVPVLAIAVAADIRLALRLHLRDLISETHEATLRAPVVLAAPPHRLHVILAVAVVLLLAVKKIKNACVNIKCQDIFLRSFYSTTVSVLCRTKKTVHACRPMKQSFFVSYVHKDLGPS